MRFSLDTYDCRMLSSVVGDGVVAEGFSIGLLTRRRGFDSRRRHLD